MTMTVVGDLLKIFRASFNAVLPDKIIRKCVTYDTTHDTLNIAGDKYNLSNKNVYIVGAGKAAQYMAREIDVILGSKIKSGIISIPAKSLAKDTKSVSSRLLYCEGAQDNLPDIAAVSTAKNIKELASSLTQNDFLIVVISGGGSALLPLPKEPITLKEKLNLTMKLANSGADINELNIVRKKLSAIKGGQLAIAASPAQTVSLILSDVVNDPLDIIASGPTVEDKDEVTVAIDIIKNHKLYEDLPQTIKKALQNKTVEIFPRDKVRNYCLGSNKVSISAAYEEAKRNNYNPIIISRAITGNVKYVSKEYVQLAKAFCDFLSEKINITILENQVQKLNIPGLDTTFHENLKIIIPKGNKFCLILGGETTVEVKGSGKGGRNQQLALEFSYYIHEAKENFKDFNINFLSAGTDGIDGPTDAAGAIGYLDLISDCEKENINVQEYLENNDSYNLYRILKSGALHVITGHTNTNVMDIHLIVIERC